MESVMLYETERRNTEVTATAKRRRFTATYKKRILREAAACKKHGELGALLRREGLYSSHLSKWKQQAAAGELSGLTPKKRGRKPQQVDPRDRQIAKLEREVATLRRRADRAEALVEVQKKLSQLLGIALPTETSEDK